VKLYGGVDLGIEPAEEFTRLRDAGFPIVYRGLADVLRRQQLMATPVKWLIHPPDSN